MDPAAPVAREGVWRREKQLWSQQRIRTGILSSAGKLGRNTTSTFRALHWHAYAFLVIAVIAGMAGFVWYADSKPPSDAFVSRQQDVQVFVSDPNARVHLTAAYAPLGPHQVLEDLYLSIQPSVPGTDVSWSLVSLHHPLDCNTPTGLANLANPRSGALASRLVFGVQPHTRPLSAWLCQGDTTGSSLGSLATLKQEVLPRIGPLQTADPIAASLTDGAFVASTPLPSVDSSSAGTFFARLPALDLEALPQPGVALVAGVELDHGEFRYLLDEYPQPLTSDQATSTNVSSFQRLPGWKAVESTPYFVPANISDQAVLELTATQSRLIDYKQDQVDPSNGSFENGNFVWTGTGYVEPTVQLSDPGSDQARTNDAFLAGVALAVAGAAVIAFLQELPQRRRKQEESG
jgi:hypothetical protein